MPLKRLPRWSAKHLNALLEYVCRRHRMFFEPTATVRDLAFYLQGVGCGLAYPHPAIEGDDEFWAFAFRKFDREPPPKRGMKPGVLVAFLVEEFGDRPFPEACDKIADLFTEWRKLHPAEVDDEGLSEYC
jgi:hypothetical protein